MQSTELEKLLDDFFKLYEIKDPLRREYALTKAVEKSSYSYDSYCRMFTIYCQQRKDEEWHHSWKAPFFYLEKFFEQINQGLSRADILKILQQLTSLSIIVAVVTFMLEIPQRQQKAIQEAWQIIIQAKGANAKASAGRIEALEFLNKRGVLLSGLEAKNAFLPTIQLPGGRLQKAHLEKSDLFQANLKNSNLYQAYLNGANLDRADLQGANLWAANLEGADIGGADMRRTNLRETNLKTDKLRTTKLEGSIYDDATQFIDENTKNNILAEHKMYKIVPKADLSGINLENFNLSKANLSGANLTNANLKGTSLYQAHLEYAVLKGAEVNSDTLSEAILCNTTMPDGQVSNRDC